MGLEPGGLKFCSLWGEIPHFVRLNMLMIPAEEKVKVFVSSWNYAWDETLLFEPERWFKLVQSAITWSAI